MPNGTQYEKWERFCQLVFTGMPHVDARAQAGYSVACSRASQVNDAKRIMLYPWVKARLAELRQKAEDESVASVLERKQVLTEIVRGRINQFVQGNRINATVNNLNSAAVSEVVTQEIQLGKGDDAAIVDVVKLKLRDPVSAIAELNKMDRVYDDSPKTFNDNRQINIIVESKEDGDALKWLREGGKIAH